MIFHDFPGLDHPFGATEYVKQNIAIEQFTPILLGYYFNKPGLEQLRQEQKDQPMPDNASLKLPSLQQDATRKLYSSKFSVWSLSLVHFHNSLISDSKGTRPPVLFAPFFAATARTV